MKIEMTFQMLALTAKTSQNLSDCSISGPLRLMLLL